MKKYRGWLLFTLAIACCVGAVLLTLQVTAEYPSQKEPVSYVVNQIEGFNLTVDEPTWSPFKGYTIRWCVETDSEDIYLFAKEEDAPEPIYLEHFIDEQWFRLGDSQDNSSFFSFEFPLGGENSHSFQGSIVQKYYDYGTRLEAGLYRIVLEIQAKDGTPCYLAAEFTVD